MCQWCLPVSLQVYIATWHQTYVAVKVLHARTEGLGAQVVDQPITVDTELLGRLREVRGTAKPVHTRAAVLQCAHTPAFSHACGPAGGHNLHVVPSQLVCLWMSHTIAAHHFSCTLPFIKRCPSLPLPASRTLPVNCRRRTCCPPCATPTSSSSWACAPSPLASSRNCAAAAH